MTIKQEVSMLELVIMFGSFGSLAGMIGGVVVGFVVGICELKQANLKLKMENSLKEHLEEVEEDDEGYDTVN